MLLKLRLTDVKHDFAITYIKQRRITIENLQLQTMAGHHDDDFTFKIRNQDIHNLMRVAFNQFRASGQTLSQFFRRTILIAKRHNNRQQHFKIIAPQTADRPLILFQCKNSYYLESEMDNVHLSSPIQMTIQDILGCYDIRKKFSLKYLEKYEEYFQIKIDFYKLSTKSNPNSHGSETIGYKCSSLPGKLKTKWNPRFSINIGNNLK